MKVLYKSSRIQTYLYYFIYPLIICISTYFILGIISYGDFGLFNIIIILIFIYALIAAIELNLTLKYVEVTENNILFKTLGNKEVLDYKNIFYVYNIVDYKGAYIVIWYKDLKTNKLKVILVRPERESIFLKQNFSSFLNNQKELEMTKYIRERAVKENSEYLNINNPRWFLFSISPTFKLK